MNTIFHLPSGSQEHFEDTGYLSRHLGHLCVFNVFTRFFFYPLKASRDVYEDERRGKGGRGKCREEMGKGGWMGWGNRARREESVRKRE